jgi:hypothetical protein
MEIKMMMIMMILYSPPLMFKMSALCYMSEFFSTDVGKLVAIHFVECCELLHKYSVLEPLHNGDFWPTQHYLVFHK